MQHFLPGAVGTRKDHAFSFPRPASPPRVPPPTSGLRLVDARAPQVPRFTYASLEAGARRAEAGTGTGTGTRTAKSFSLTPILKRGSSTLAAGGAKRRKTLTAPKRVRFSEKAIYFIPTKEDKTTYMYDA